MGARLSQLRALALSHFYFPRASRPPILYFTNVPFPRFPHVARPAARPYHFTSTGESGCVSRRLCALLLGNRIYARRAVLGVFYTPGLSLCLGINSRES